MIKNIKKFGLSLLVLGLVLVGSFSLAPTAHAAAGDFDLLVNNELGATLAGAIVTAVCPGVGATPFTMVDAGAGHYTAGFGDLQAAAPAGPDCTGGELITFNVAKDGYVTTINSSHLYDNLGTPDIYTLSPGVPFAVKVVLDDETVANNNVSGASAVQAGGTSCAEDLVSGIYYCPVPLATLSTDVVVQKDGYVQKTISSAFDDRISATEVQRIVGTGGDVTTAVDFQHAHKITAARQSDGTLLTGATITAGGTLCTEDTGGGVGNYYCATPVGNDNVGAGNVSIVKTGYVTNTTFGTSNRLAQTSGGGTGSATNIIF